MTSANRAEIAYAAGVTNFNEFLRAPSLASWARAMNSLGDAIASPGINPEAVTDAHYKTGLLWLFDSNYENALAYFRNCLSIRPQASVHEAIGAVYAALRQYERSAVHYRQAIRLGSTPAMGYMGLGRALLEMGEIEEALDCFAKSISSKPSANAHFWKGNAFRRAGETKRAIECYLAAVGIDKEDPEACQALAETYLEDEADAVSALVWFDRMYTLPGEKGAKDYCRTRTPFAAYFCERYPEESNRESAFEVLCGLRRAVIAVKENLCCDAEGAAVHYTSLDTMKALVRERSPFRAHRADRTNDPSEGGILRRLIGEDVLEEFRGSDDGKEEPSAFIASFVARRDGAAGVRADDNLLHWRLYGKSGGVEGGGACLVYPCSLFSQQSDKHETASLYHSHGLFAGPTVTRRVSRWQALTPRLYSVAYEGAAEQVVAELRKRLTRIGVFKAEVTSDGERRILSDCVRVLLEEIRFLFKSSNFEYEKEARVVVMVWPNDPGIARDPSSGKEYIELRQTLYPAEVVMGPCVAGEQLAGFDGRGSTVRVRKSEVDYVAQ